MKAVATTVACALLVACEVGLENDQLGVLQDQSDRVHILYVGCHQRDERILSVQLVRVRGSLGGDDDATVWRAEALEHVGEIDLIVGEKNAAFEETVALSGALSGTYAIIVATSLDDSVVQGVDIASLSHGLVDIGLGEPVSRQDFVEAAREACR